MKGYLKNNATIFGEFNSIEINGEFMIKVLTELSEFNIIPSVFDEFEIEVINNVPKQKINKRTQFISDKNNFRIICASNHIVVESGVNLVGGELQSDNPIEYFKMSGIIIAKLALILGLKGNRISLVSSYYDDAKINYNDYIIPPKFYNDKELFEWSMRSVSRENLVLQDGTPETVNIVHSISRVHGVLGTQINEPNEIELNGYLYDIDINTIPENLTSRMDEAYIIDFYEKACMILENLKS